jgi:ankyrin repeat protein
VSQAQCSLFFAADEVANTPLHLAAGGGFEDVCRLLLSARADGRMRNSMGEAPLDLAVGRWRARRLFFSSFSDMDLGPEGNLSESEDIVSAGEGEVAAIAEQTERRLKMRLGVEARSNDCTALHLAAREGDVLSTEVLLTGKANVSGRVLSKLLNAKTRHGCTPLYMAAEEGNHPVVKLLLTASADPDACDEDGATPLHMAAQNGHMQACTTLLDCGGAEIDAVKRGGATALSLAATGGYSDMVAALLRAKAEIDAASDMGVTPLISAAAGGHVQTLKMLLQARADFDCRDASGATALICAAGAGRAATLQSLILEGAALDTATHAGGTALIAACESNHQAAARTLVLARADLDLQMKGGATALMLACLNGHEAVSHMLLQEGAKIYGAALSGDGLNAFPEDQRKLLENLIKLSYPGCAEVQATLLRKSATGLMLQIRSFETDGSRQVPTLIRLGLEMALREEAASLAETLQYLGGSGATVLRGPMYLESHGACVLQLSGACWLLPDFVSSKVTTFSEFLCPTLAVEALDNTKMAEIVEDSLGIIAQLWAVGGGLRSLADTTKLQIEVPSLPGSVEMFTNAGPFLNDLAKTMSHVLLPARDNERWADYKNQLPPSLWTELSRLVDRGRLVWAQRAAAEAAYAVSPLSHAPDESRMAMLSEAKPLADCLRLLNDLTEEAPAAHWLEGWKPIRATVHGALVCDSLIVDACGRSWLFDLANARSGSLFDDAAHLIADILFSQLQPPDESALLTQCAAFDAFVPLDAAELWEIGSRDPPTGLTSGAELALRLCSGILLQACRFVHSLSSDPRELHMTSFLCPLLIQAFKRLGCRSSLLHQRAIWHGAMRCAAGIVAALARPPVEPPNLSNEVVRVPLKLAEQSVMMRGSAMGGAASDYGLALITTAVGDECHVISLASVQTASVFYDDIDSRRALRRTIPTTSHALLLVADVLLTGKCLQAIPQRSDGRNRSPGAQPIQSGVSIDATPAR